MHCRWFGSVLIASSLYTTCARVSPHQGDRAGLMHRAVAASPVTKTVTATATATTTTEAAPSVQTVDSTTAPPATPTNISGVLKQMVDTLQTPIGTFSRLLNQTNITSADLQANPEYQTALNQLAAGFQTAVNQMAALKPGEGVGSRRRSIGSARGYNRRQAAGGDGLSDDTASQAVQQLLSSLGSVTSFMTANSAQPDLLGTLLSDVFTTIGPIVEDLLSTVTDLVGSVVGSATDLLTGVAGGLLGPLLGSDGLVGGLVNGLLGGL